VNVPKRGIGATTVGHLDRFAEAEGVGFAGALARVADNPRVAARAQQRIGEFLALLEELRARADDGPRAALEAVLELTGYQVNLEEEGTIEALSRVENLRELTGVAEEFETSGPLGGTGDDDWDAMDGTRKLELFLESISLSADVDSLDEDTGMVTLMTLHNAKGLEFPVIFIGGMEEGVFPHMRSLGDPGQLEEERRLAYVGITRAEERLYLSLAISRNLWGMTNYNTPSRFLREIPEPLITEAKKRTRRPDREAAVPQQTLDGDQLAQGDRIRHRQWGVGTVSELSGSGDRAEVVVDFDDQGRKRLLLAWAPLERV
jgi:DNA helicase-2/ATP-dependent DNA helicase PcrA